MEIVWFRLSLDQLQTNKTCGPGFVSASRIENGPSTSLPAEPAVHVDSLTARIRRQDCDGLGSNKSATGRYRIRFAKSAQSRLHRRRRQPAARQRLQASSVYQPSEAASPRQQRMPDSAHLDHPPPADQNSEPPAAANAQPNPVAVKPKMIIKAVLGRYERWNPVHPTAGAFWGMGLGLGCGVGWGPGFGPEVIGYVGAGCGVGFSVGFTIAGVGIGLPQHVLVKNYDQPGFLSNVPLESARLYTMTIIRGLVGDAISYASQLAAVSKGVSKFQDNSQVSGGIDLPKLGKRGVK